ncbi:MAG: valine--tRNA ligase [Deltaproteobacteria bacterium]|nr:valine--tRNA ligase [Deltaproteobacteria bacterium]
MSHAESSELVATPDAAACELPKAYEPRAVEAAWYPRWCDAGLFHAADKTEKDGKGDGRKSFSIVIPPPNVTGALHMGHALNCTLQDIVVRLRRMQGYNVCWLPGTDHAGIATQNVVEKQLATEGVTRQQLGRDAFVQRVWDWKKQYGDRIVEQLQRLGASCDWSRQRFTLDDGCSRAVREVFVRLHERGLIYRGEYLINWCPRCHTALSDLEVEHEAHQGSLWHVRYPLTVPELSEDEATAHESPAPSPQPSAIIVATTRPETMLGDVAVAVHPDDERYQSLIGQRVILPLTGRTIPIIADQRVDRAFGTGAVKVTPAHDLNDVRIGNDHKLPRINIFTSEAAVNEHGGVFAGLDRFEARKKVVEGLEQLGLLEKTEPHAHNVGHCYRCKTVVEPSLSPQWFVKVQPLAAAASAAVRKGQTHFSPKSWEKTYFDWMERIEDWCISRQIWWGHRIPAWYCVKAGEAKGACPPLVARERPARCPQCGDTELRQDDDVLDTWFSSALWPFATFGWPDQTTALKTFYPTSLLITGFDILFFWVARMMMLGLHCMGEVPFHHVYFTPLVRDPLGQKMSKSKGNVIDPLAVIDRFGTDALRFTLAALSVQGRDIKLSEERIEGYKHFCNKLWNAARFLLLQLGAFEGDVAAQCGPDADPVETCDLALADRWILHQYQQTVRAVTKALEAYEFDTAAHCLYRFVWHELCDWYVEASKPRFRGGIAGRQATLKTLVDVFDGTLRLLHPFMPFISEELWQRLRVAVGGPAAWEGRRSLVVAAWPPVTKHPLYIKEAKLFDQLARIITAIRTIRSEHQIPPVQRLAVVLRTTDPTMQKVIGTHGTLLRELARLDRLEMRVSKVCEGPMAAAVVDGVEVYVPLRGLIDVDAERARLQKEIEKVEKTVQGVQATLANASFVERAPAEIVEAERERLAAAAAERQHLDAVLARLVTTQG